jgi:hypothetical protein
VGSHPACPDWHFLKGFARLEWGRSSCWRVLLGILGSCDDSGVANMSIAELSTLTGLSERTVKAALAVMLRDKVVVRLGRYGRISVPLLRRGGARKRSGLTTRQVWAVRRALRELSLIHLRDMECEVVPEPGLFSLPVGTTYGGALELLRGADPASCRAFVGSVLALRSNGRLID